MLQGLEKIFIKLFYEKLHENMIMLILHYISSNYKTSVLEYITFLEAHCFYLFDNVQY